MAQTLNRKGNVMDVMVILGILMIMGVTAVIVGFVITSTRDALLSDPNTPTEANSIMGHVDDQWPGVMDWWFGLFLVGLPLISAGLAYFNDIHPLFFWLSLGLILLVVIVGAGGKELWDSMRTDTDLSTAMDRYPLTGFVMEHFAVYSFFCFIIVAMGTYIKLRRGGYGGGF